jgi:hypothetical protein
MVQMPVLKREVMEARDGESVQARKIRADETASRLAAYLLARKSAAPGSRVPGNLADAIRAIVDPVGGIELDLPERGGYREPPRFDWFEPEN